MNSIWEINAHRPHFDSLYGDIAVDVLIVGGGIIGILCARALKYNKAGHRWDCHCHGSRFTKDGKLIDNPATDDKSGMA